MDGLTLGACLLILLGGAGMALCGRALYRQWSSRQWPQVPGTILNAAIEHDAGNQRYGIAVEYAYRVGGAALQGARLGFGPAPTFPSREAAASCLQAYRPGQTQPVFVDPRNPAQAVLHPGMSGWSLLPLAIACVPLYLGFSLLVKAISPAQA